MILLQWVPINMGIQWRSSNLSTLALVAGHANLCIFQLNLAAALEKLNIVTMFQCFFGGWIDIHHVTKFPFFYSRSDRRPIARSFRNIQPKIISAELRNHQTKLKRNPSGRSSSINEQTLKQNGGRLYRKNKDLNQSFNHSIRNPMDSIDRIIRSEVRRSIKRSMGTTEQESIEDSVSNISLSLESDRYF